MLEDTIDDSSDDEQMYQSDELNLEFGVSGNYRVLIQELRNILPDKYDREVLKNAVVGSFIFFLFFVISLIKVQFNIFLRLHQIQLQSHEEKETTQHTSSRCFEKSEHTLLF